MCYSHWKWVTSSVGAHHVHEVEQAFVIQQQEGTKWHVHHISMCNFRSTTYLYNHDYLLENSVQALIWYSYFIIYHFLYYCRVWIWTCLFPWHDWPRPKLSWQLRAQDVWVLSAVWEENCRRCLWIHHNSCQWTNLQSSSWESAGSSVWSWTPCTFASGGSQ